MFDRPVELAGTNQPTNNLFSAIRTNIANNIADNSGRLPEKPYGSMNWSHM